LLSTISPFFGRNPVSSRKHALSSPQRRIRQRIPFTLFLFFFSFLPPFREKNCRHPHPLGFTPTERAGNFLLSLCNRVPRHFGPYPLFLGDGLRALFPLKSPPVGGGGLYLLFDEQERRAPLPSSSFLRGEGNTFIFETAPSLGGFLSNSGFEMSIPSNRAFGSRS